ncbi:hypothetical protein OE903_08750 [Bacillus sp. B6(2022)]|nr:hypothetical protein [Bacillus sp. B6(2022)]
MHVQLHQKVALVTDSTDGFGEAICLALARAGAHVFIHAFVMNQKQSRLAKTLKN